MKDRNVFIKMILILSISIISSLYSTTNILAAYNIKDKYVLIGGNLLAIETQLEYPIVVNVDKQSKVKKFDFLVSYKSEYSKKQNIEDISKLNEVFKMNKYIYLEVIRNDKIKNIKIKKEDIKNIQVENKLKHVATLTYIDINNKSFGCMAHPITLKEKILIPIKPSNVTLPRYVDTKTNNKIKYLDVITSKEDKCIGIANENSRFGVFGKVNNELDYTNYKICKVGNFEDIELGEATLIFNNLRTNQIDEFKIYITNINTKNKYKERGFKFEVIDERFIEQNGGVILGMSGSPIIQNNNIIGAVSHSNLKFGGSALYIGNMIK